MKKINEINDIESISVFHKGMALGYDRQKNVLFISEDIGDVIYKVPFRRNLLSIMENKLFSFDNNLYVYDEVLKNWVLIPVRKYLSSRIDELAIGNEGKQAKNKSFLLSCYFM